MAPSFPGMNPYLENPSLSSEVHSWLIVELARSLNPLLVPKYRAAVEKRVYLDTLLVGIPDASVFQQTPESEPSCVVTTGVLSKPILVTVPLTEEITERYLEIREVKTGRVVTVVEVLSPKNKRVGEGRDKYLTKRQKVLNSTTHLVEIDLLRTGNFMPMAEAIPSHYRILVSRANLRPEAELYPFNVRESMPQFLLPLQSGDEEPVVNLSEILGQVYQEAALDLAIDYSVQPVPALSESDFQWVRSLIEL
ncbi:DUF4058 family protein [Oscillatoria sp. FACHB-1406]|uniref:DUF4058 family protein n=1 Tax=Oscillatoria sp. FACHB-1406 TaxID=2692846 RepID=UPI001687679C|nr:DUF4058 family protein [Oscillatoria sp. FACHB-1406]MBD2577476.1 DUF4058 family protein [Oscillatoria sp. FACHB-1406]